MTWGNQDIRCLQNEFSSTRWSIPGNHGVRQPVDTQAWTCGQGMFIFPLDQAAEKCSPWHSPQSSLPLNL